MTKKSVLITGCSSGFGRLTAKKFQQEGWNVAATMRSPEKEQELNTLENVIVMKLDVTDKKNVNEAVGQVIEQFGTIDVLVNNAGYGGHALFEQFSEEDIHAMYDTNVFGVMRVAREVLPFMRKQKEGTIINVTSMVGLIGGASVTVYSSTKFAIEGFSESLALEYKPLNIKVKTVAPGAFPTNFTTAGRDNFDSGKDDLKSYAQQLLTSMGAVMERTREREKQSNPKDVADKIYECATTETPIHNIVGSDVERIVGMKNSMPHQEFLDKMFEICFPKFKKS